MVLLLQFFALAPLLRFAHVVAGRAAGHGAEHGVMARVMAGDPAGDGAGQAADRMGGVDRSEQTKSAGRGEQEAHRYDPFEKRWRRKGRRGPWIASPLVALGSSQMTVKCGDLLAKARRHHVLELPQ